MAYFPFFVDLTGVSGLIVGGGTVAARKVQQLLPFGPELTVAAPEILPELAALPGLRLLRESFRRELLEGTSFVIAATDDRAENREIALACRERNIPVNAVDDREACTFLFPALVRDGPLTVGISTSGTSPAAAAWLRRRVEACLPEGFGAILTCLEEVRPRVRATVSSQRDRARLYRRLLERCLERGGPLEEGEIRRMLEGEEET